VRNGCQVERGEEKALRGKGRGTAGDAKGTGKKETDVNEVPQRPGRKVDLQKELIGEGEKITASSYPITKIEKVISEL